MRELLTVLIMKEQHARTLASWVPEIGASNRTFRGTLESVLNICEVLKRPPVIFKDTN